MTPGPLPLMSDETKLSPVEGFKLEGNFLRGDIAAELRDGNDHFGKSSIQLLKHHGTYQQDDRDARALGRTEGHKGKPPKPTRSWCGPRFRGAN